MTKTEPKPGQVAMVTMRRPESWASSKEHTGGTYLALYNGVDKCWVSAEGDLSPEGDAWVHEVKPLVVLDLYDASETANVLRFKANSSADPRVRSVIRELIHQIQPSRIPEPSWGEKVVAGIWPGGERFTWIKTGISTHPYVSEKGGVSSWENLYEPELVGVDA